MENSFKTCDDYCKCSDCLQKQKDSKDLEQEAKKKALFKIITKNSVSMGVRG